MNLYLFNSRRTLGALRSLIGVSLVHFQFLRPHPRIIPLAEYETVIQDDRISPSSTETGLERSSPFQHPAFGHRRLPLMVYGFCGRKNRLAILRPPCLCRDTVHAFRSAAGSPVVVSPSPEGSGDQQCRLDSQARLFSDLYPLWAFLFRHDPGSRSTGCHGHRSFTTGNGGTGSLLHSSGPHDVDQSHQPPPASWDFSASPY